MKKTMLFLLITVASVQARAWYESNPDHRPSVGVNFGGKYTSGRSNVWDNTLSASQRSVISNLDFILDTRIPLTEDATFNAAFGFGGLASKSEEESPLNRESFTGREVLFNVGLRFYIGD